MDCEKDSSSHMWAGLGGFELSERNPNEFAGRGLYILRITPRNDCPELCKAYADDLRHDIHRMVARLYAINRDPIVNVTVNL